MSIDRREAIKRTSFLLGGLVFAPSAVGVLKGCTPDPGVDWKPAYFSTARAKLVEELSEVIMPSGDTPGARESGVPAFIEKMVYEAYSKEDRDSFNEGLDELNDKIDAEYGRNYADLSADLKYEFAVAQNREGDSFFLAFKRLVMLGYFNTEAGATQLLRYVSVPGRYDGCIPFEEGDTAWL